MSIVHYILLIMFVPVFNVHGMTNNTLDKPDKLECYLARHTRTGETELHTLAMSADQEILNRFVASHAPEKILSMLHARYQGHAAIHRAAVFGNHVVLRFLLEQKVPVDICDEKQDTPLYLACENLSPACVRILLDYDADVHVQGISGTPLHKVIKNMYQVAEEKSVQNAFDCIVLLLERGARVDMLDNDEKKPIDCVEPEHRNRVQTAIVQGLNARKVRIAQYCSVLATVQNSRLPNELLVLVAGYNV
jgi:ankyrin repeat protein